MITLGRNVMVQCLGFLQELYEHSWLLIGITTDHFYHQFVTQRYVSRV